MGFTDRIPEAPVSRISPSAKTLALAHRIVRAVEDGEVRDFSAAARRLGVSQARVSMLVTLTFLAPDIQAAVLLGTGPRLSFKRLLRLARMARWEAQHAALAHETPSEQFGQNLSGR